jgi:hypothetical protein
MLTLTKPKEKIVCLRNFEVALYADVKAQAKAEGLLVKDWIERAVIHELVRARKQPLVLEAEPKGASSGKIAIQSDGCRTKNQLNYQTAS